MNLAEARLTARANQTGWYGLPGHRPWATAACVLLLLLTLMAPLNGLVEGTDWMFWFAAFGGGVLVLGAALRALGLPGWVVTITQILVVPPALIACFAGGHAILGVFPNGETWQRFSEMGKNVALAIVLEYAPLSPQIGLTALVALGAAVVAIVFDWYTFTVRAPAATGLFMALVMVLPVAFLREGLALSTLVLPAAAYLLVLAVTNPVGRPRLPVPGAGLLKLFGALRSVVVGCVALALAAAAAWALPGLTSEPLIKPSVGPARFVSGVNPLVELGSDLRQQGDDEVLRYTTDAGPMYLRMTSLSQFDGTRWTHRKGQQVAFEPERSTKLPGISESGLLPTYGAQAEVFIEITNLRATTLPAPYLPLAVREAAGEWVVDQDDLTISAELASTTDQAYTVTVVTPRGLDSGLDEVMTVTKAVAAELALPEDLPQIIGQTAVEVLAEAAQSPDYDGSYVAQARALQDYFRRSGGFTYSTSTPVEDGFDGDSAAVVARFLEVKSGYCVHFAAAMTLMARYLGIPARIAIGYLPGSPVVGSGGGSGAGQPVTYSVKANQLHAWPELYLPGAGWVGFEPTAARADAPSYAPDPSSTATSSASGSASPTPSPSRSQASPRSRSASPDVTETATATATVPGGLAGGTVWPGWVTVAPGGLGGLAVLALAALGPMVGRRARRRGRLLGDQALAGAWDEVHDTATDLGLGVGPALTPADFGRHLKDLVGGGEAGAAVDFLVADVERAAYQPGGLTGAVAGGEQRAGYRAAVAAIVRALGLTVPRGRRLRAALWPRTLRRPHRS
ncbi:MAG: DUF3488 and transglutaminase-like domain-containing protein [Bifidobacteriaceae bacterium]|jgi:transglutaminase-like putative cysteine protease|nr:DUF3488 and transglutaminase-like domain-containing protein [Bifidobacteriaceae bacterium]